MKAILFPSMLWMALSVLNVSAKTEIPTSKPSSSKTSSGVYTVRRGDSIEGIARKSGVSASALSKTNGINSSAIIHPGQKLKLPSGATVSPSSTSSKGSGKTHKIQANETFYSISKKYGVSTDALIAANPKAKPSALHPGQIISLPSGSKSSSPKAAKAKKSTKPLKSKPKAKEETTPEAPPAPKTEAQPKHEEPKPAPAPAPKSPSDPETTPPAPAAPAASHPAPATSSATPLPESNIRSIKIEEEITFSDFAKKHGTTIEKLNNLNGLDLGPTTPLAKGSELYVPSTPSQH